MLAAVVQIWMALTVFAALALLGVMVAQRLVRFCADLVARHPRTLRLTPGDELRHVHT